MRKFLSLFDPFLGHLGYIFIILAIIVYAIVFMALSKDRLNHVLSCVADSGQLLAEFSNVRVGSLELIPIEYPSPQKRLFIRWWPPGGVEGLWFGDSSRRKAPFWCYVRQRIRGVDSFSSKQHIIWFGSLYGTLKMLQNFHCRSGPRIVPDDVNRETVGFAVT